MTSSLLVLVLAGQQHITLSLKREFSPELNMFTNQNVYVDLGYLGIQKDYQFASLSLPHKKLRKSKKNPTPSLSLEQKMYNQTASRKRICVENAIAGMKRYHILRT